MNPITPRRVLFVDHVRHIPAGAEVNLLELTSEPAARNTWDIHVACDPDGALRELLAARGIPCHRHAFHPDLAALRTSNRRLPVSQTLRGLRSLAQARKALADIVRDVQPAVVVSCTNRDHFASWPACRIADIPSVWWMNDILSPDFFPWTARRAFCLQARRGASRIAAVSDFSRQALLREGLPADRLATIHNGIPLERYRRQPRGSLRPWIAARDDEPVIGMVGRFTPWKGQDFFLRLAQTWCQASPLGQFVLIGQALPQDQPFEQALRDFVRSHDLRERVHLIPFQRDIAAALSDLDVLVHTSTKPEPFGRVLIEAMAVGVPVLAANSGGVPEIIRHNENGLLATPGNLPDYHQALSRLLHEPDLRLRLQQAAQHTVHQHFSLSRVQAAFENLFLSLNPHKPNPSTPDPQGP